MTNETIARIVAGILYRAAQEHAGVAVPREYRDVVVALAHYANGTALARDYRAALGRDW